MSGWAGGWGKVGGWAGVVGRSARMRMARRSAGWMRRAGGWRWAGALPEFAYFLVASSTAFAIQQPCVCGRVRVQALTFFVLPVRGMCQMLCECARSAATFDWRAFRNQWVCVGACGLECGWRARVCLHCPCVRFALKWIAGRARSEGHARVQFSMQAYVRVLAPWRVAMCARASCC